jgi:ribosome-binding factor A
VDPDFLSALEEHSGKRSNRRADHKARQLCRQVQRAIGFALGGGFLDAELDALLIADVSPTPGCARLLVHVVIPSRLNAETVLGKLRERTPRLRAEVARSICRKRAPELTFVQAMEESP